MSYQKAIKYLESFINYEMISDWGYKDSFKLDSFKGFLDMIGNPQDAFISIHVAGSKGKGSTCAFISYILREAGYKTGLYTSPHLVDFRERIRILRAQSASVLSELRRTRRSTKCVGGAHKYSDCFEGKIPKAKLVDLVERLKPVIDKYNRISNNAALSFFEVYTALAFIYFKEEKIDFAVIETGLGGRLDATNAVDSLVCAITPISYEHTQKLGNTLREIAAEKAGIIKRVTGNGLQVTKRVNFCSSYPESRISYPVICPPIVISAPQEKEALDVIKNRCRKVGAKLFEVGKNITWKKTKNGFTVKGILGTYPNLKIKLLGGHQLTNASVAVGVIEGLRLYGVEVGIDSIQKGAYNTSWPGRCEVVSRDPLIVLDGAQNAASAEVLKRAVKESFRYRRLILALGISSDKDKKGICGQLCGFADAIILTQANNPRAADVEDIEKIIKAQGIRHKIKVIKTKNVKCAMKKALDMAKTGDLILITGSLFVVGEARRLL